MSEQTAMRSKSRRILVGAVLVLVAAMVVPLTGYVYVAVAQPQIETAADWQETNPRSEYWREVRQGTEGYSAVKGPAADVLIDNGGQIFRQIRNGPISTFGPWVLAIMLLGVAGMFVLSGGGQKVEKPLSGKRVPRWSAYVRVVHWIMAIAFLLLLITGLSLLFGRAVLIPLLGAEGFSAWAITAKYIHNFTGPVFAVTLVLLVLSMLRDNLPSKVDVDWFLKGGFAGKHVPTGKLNAGEKLWFWFNAVGGLVVAVSGVVLILPNIFEARSTMQLALLVHAGLALLYIGGSFVHMYMGTLGARGALDAITKGHVSSEWAEQHHDLWYHEVKKDGEEFVSDEDDARSNREMPATGSGSTA
ncbi:MAG: formate dehydrogenase subunit gamma [Xanthomonadales bacterium]|jgi:formate dehydrogenase subunit gamma|nr:formate dehydrogenase subunit gamma [Xanthomonadales bacterium]